MRTLLVTATLTQTTALGVAGRADYRQATYDHVPGSVLRGALAATWLRTPGAPGPDDTLFHRVFEGDGAFGPLHSPESLPIPLSAWTHKAIPIDACSTTTWDEIDGTVPETCPVCPPTRGKLERSKGQPTGSPRIGARSRVELDDSGVAADGKLFRRAALDAGTVLTGWVTGPAADAFTPGGETVASLRFGGERSIRGLAHIRIDEATPPPTPIVDNQIVLRLAAPGVFVDKFGFPADKPSPNEIGAILGVKVGITSKPGWTRWTEVGGWHMASGLPKPRDRAVAAGSTYLVKCAQTPQPDRLAALAARGVGLRRREGYGALYRARTTIRETPLRATLQFAAVAPVVSWRKWPKFEPHLRASTPRPLPPDSPLWRVLQDTTLTPAEQNALQVLLNLHDDDILLRMLDELATR